MSISAHEYLIFYLQGFGRDIVHQWHQLLQLLQLHQRHQLHLLLQDHNLEPRHVAVKELLAESNLM